MKKLKGVISVFALSLCLLSPAQAEEQRYISIRNTDMVWVPGNVCVWQFRTDNGGSGEGFGPLTLSLRLKDKGEHAGDGEYGGGCIWRQRCYSLSGSFAGERMRGKR